MEQSTSATASGLSLAARAALELRLQEARRERSAAVVEKNGYTLQADEFRAWADEPCSHTTRVSRRASAIKYRLRAASMDAEISQHDNRIAMLEGMLAGSQLKTEAVNLPRDAVAGMDDMAFSGVPA